MIKPDVESKKAIRESENLRGHARFPRLGKWKWLEKKVTRLKVEGKRLRILASGKKSLNSEG